MQTGPTVLTSCFPLSWTWRLTEQMKWTPIWRWLKAEGESGSAKTLQRLLRRASLTCPLSVPQRLSDSGEDRRRLRQKVHRHRRLQVCFFCFLPRDQSGYSPRRWRLIKLCWWFLLPGRTPALWVSSGRRVSPSRSSPWPTCPSPGPLPSASAGRPNCVWLSVKRWVDGADPPPPPVTGPRLFLSSALCCSVAKPLHLHNTSVSMIHLSFVTIPFLCMCYDVSCCYGASSACTEVNAMETSGTDSLGSFSVCFENLFCDKGWELLIKTPASTSLIFTSFLNQAGRKNTTCVCFWMFINTNINWSVSEVHGIVIILLGFWRNRL